MLVQNTTFHESCKVYITPVWRQARVSNDVIMRRYCVCIVSHKCEYGHVSSPSQCTVHHKYKICMFSPRYGYRRIPSDYCTVRIEHHRYQFGMVFPVWIWTWAFKLRFSVNCALQISHLYGFSPVWIRTWFFK